jgi:hypothetical protein
MTSAVQQIHGWSAIVLSETFFLIVAIPTAMALIAAMMRLKTSKNPFVAPTDLFGAILVADLTIAIEPSMLTPLFSDIAESGPVRYLHGFAVLFGVIAWIYCIMWVEPNLESDGAAQHQSASTLSYFSVKWLVAYAGVVALVATHYFAYSLRMWTKL